MAQPLARPQSAPRPGPSTTALVLGGLALLAVVGGVIALSSGSAAAAPSPSPPPPPPPSGGAGAGTPCPTTGLNGQHTIYRLADSGKTVAMTSIDTIRTALLIQPAQIPTYDWFVSSSDDSILTKYQRTTGPDPVSLNGTDRLDYWRGVGSGTVTLTGQLLPKSGTGTPIATFTLTVQVTCASGSGGGAGATQNSRTLTAGKSYTISVISTQPFTVPSRNVIESSLATALGVAHNKAVHLDAAGGDGRQPASEPQPFGPVRDLGRLASAASRSASARPLDVKYPTRGRLHLSGHVAYPRWWSTFITCG